jgi:hypothetical protein
LDASAAGKAFPAFAGTSLRRFSDRPLRHASFYDALCLDVVVPGVLRVPIEVIVIYFGLKDWIPVKIAGCMRKIILLSGLCARQSLKSIK